MTHRTIIYEENQITLKNKSDSLCRSLGHLFFDIESMKRIRAPENEINDLRQVWFDILQEYRQVQKQLYPGN